MNDLIDYELHDISEVRLMRERDMDFLDKVECVIADAATEFPPELSLTHIFTPGLYCRKILIPKGSIGTSKIHKTQHPFVILQGKIDVWTEREGTIHYTAPFMGITYPGTRRLLYAHEDTIWVTFHPTDKTNVKEIEDEITYVRPTSQALLLT